MRMCYKTWLTMLLVGLAGGLGLAQQPVPQPQPGVQPRPVTPPPAQPVAPPVQPVAPSAQQPQFAPPAQPAVTPPAAAAPAAPVAPASPAAPQAPAAMVNGQPIPEVAVQRSLKSVPPDKHAQVRPDVIDFLIDNALVEQYLVSQNVAVDAKDIDARLNEVKGQMSKDKLDYGKVLQDMMLSEPELKNVIAAEMRWEKFINTQATDAALRDLFAKNPDMFDGSMVRARHILLTPATNDAATVEQTKQQALALRKQIDDAVNAGLAKLPPTADALAREKERSRLLDEAFAAQAVKFSTCPSSKQGGDVNWFPRAGSMVEPFARTAFALKPYQLSEPVQSQFGVHLILPTDRKAGKAGVKFEDVKNDVKDIFAGRMRENLCTQLRARAKITMK